MNVGQYFKDSTPTVTGAVALRPPRTPRARNGGPASGAALAGFTLVELIAVLIITGILAVAAIPRLSALNDYAEITFRDQVRSALEYARKSAVAQRRNVQVTVGANSVTLSIASGSPEGGAANTFNRTLALPGTTSNVLNAPAGIAINPTPTLVISPLGRPSAGAVLNITNAGAVTLEAETGYVH